MIGLAPSARAAREPETGSDIGSTTIACHLVERREIDVSTVVVVDDEAGMAGVRDIAAVVDQVTRAEAKVILVGDPKQLSNPHRFGSTYGSWSLRCHGFVVRRPSSTVSGVPR